MLIYVFGNLTSLSSNMKDVTTIVIKDIYSKHYTQKMIEDAQFPLTDEMANIINPGSNREKYIADEKEIKIQFFGDITEYDLSRAVDKFSMPLMQLDMKKKINYLAEQNPVLKEMIDMLSHDPQPESGVDSLPGSCDDNNVCSWQEGN